MDFGAQAEAFAALLTHWNLDRPHVIAHDFGGAVSLRAHLIGGADYASLLLADVVAIPPSGSPFFQFVHDNPDLLGRLPAYIHAAVVRTYIQAASHRGLREEDLDALLRPWTGETGQPAFYRQIADYDEAYLEENEAHLDQIAIPVHILWGTEDAWIPTRSANGCVIRFPAPRSPSSTNPATSSSTTPPSRSPTRSAPGCRANASEPENVSM